ncbi:MAG: hypothetical protein JW864_11515 [Spirochaetes bacterium]|nr:hypothetical protein [Spirochaetota bacterium]
MRRISACLTILFTSLLILSCSSTDKKDSKSDKIKDGYGKIFWNDGSLKGKGNFKNYQMDGKWVLYHRGSGEKLAEGNYLNDKQDGPWIFLYKNGAKSTEGSFLENQKTGEWTGYYDNNALMWKAVYILINSDFGKVGVINGKKTTFSKSGKVKMIEEFKNGIKKGRFQEFYEDGTPKEISWYKDDKHNGKCNTYWDNGNSKEQGFYIDDLKNGVWKYFYDNGQTQMTGKYSMGKLQVKTETKKVSQMQGQWQFFSKEGLLQKEGKYKNNKEDGLWKFYTYPSRRQRVLQMELTLQGGMATGFGKIYENGYLTGSGDLMGPVKGIYEKIINNKSAGEEAELNVPQDNPNANLKYKWTGKWQLPRKSGKWTGYFAGGKQKQFEGTYMMDKLNGKYKEYFSNGKVKASGEYMNGKKSGVWEVYNKNGTKNEEESGRWMMGKKSKF